MTKLPEKKLPVKLIALDLDDTLLNDSREISDENVHVLRRAASLGIYVVLCSGRAEDAILPFVRRLDLAGTQAGRIRIKKSLPTYCSMRTGWPVKWDIIPRFTVPM